LRCWLMSPILCNLSKHSLKLINLALRNCLPEHGAKPAASCVVLPAVMAIAQI